MKLSTRARYGTRALLDIALQPVEKPIPLKEVAQRQEISLQYLEHLITPLIAAGMVRSVRGIKGGVWLAKSPQEIRLSEVIKTLEGSTALVECVDDPEFCSRYNICVTREVWSELKRAIDDVLEDTTLQDLVERQRMRERGTEQMYYI